MPNQQGNAKKARLLALLSAVTISALAGCGPRRPWADLQPPPAQLARRVADRVLIDFPQPPPFDWGEGVLMAGMMRTGLALEEPRYIHFVQAWADHWRAKGLHNLLPDGPTDQIKGYCGYWGPGYPVMLLHEHTGDPAYLNMVQQIADFIEHDATRLRDGGLGHWKGNYQLWVDTLYMVGPPFAHLTKVTGDPRYLDEAVRQVNIFQARNQDAGGLFWHMYDEPGNRRHGMWWGRGNGWVTMTYVMLLQHLPPCSPAYPKLKADFARQMDALLAVQDKQARLWHTVVDHPETPLETSATAMILASLVEARQGGFYRAADPDVIPSTWAALATKVDAQGRVFDVSDGTAPQDLAHYAGRPRGTFTWGTGAFLIAAAALAP